MRIPWLCAFISMLLAVSFWTSAAMAGTAYDALRVQIKSLVRQGSALSQQRQTLITAQQNLLQQKQALETVEQQLSDQQTRLNQQAQAHNQQVATQKKNLRKNQSECNNMGVATGANTSEHVNECDNEIKALNVKTTDINTNVSGLAAQQAAVAQQMADNSQKINAWYPQEQQTVNHLNLVYQKTNDWMDRAYDLIASSRFQRTARAVHADKDCSANNQPAGTITTQQLETAADYALNCLRRVLLANAGSR